MNPTTLIPVAGLVVLLASCTTVQGPQDPAVYRADIERLEQRVAADSTDAAALRDLGVIYSRTGDFTQARSFLRRAYVYDTADPETRYHYGLALEAVGDRAAALDVYEGYEGGVASSPYRKRLAGRYAWLVREVVREEIADLVAREATFGEPPPNTVAVFPLAYQGGDDRYEALGRGLSELLTIDLSRVERLTVVERVRLNALLAELELAESDVVDPGTAPRVGRILGARRMVSGTYAILDGDELRVDAGSWVAGEGPAPSFDTRSDALDNLFVLEKDLAFGVLQDLGIEPTPDERDAIERVPTRNLQAFLAYSHGLLDQDAGRYDAAARQFQRAATLDPTFNEAVQQAEATDGIAEAGGAAALVAVMAPGGPPLPGDDLVLSRQQSLGASVGTLYIPGQDVRDTPSEAPALLPAPRRPPPRNN